MTAYNVTLNTNWEALTLGSVNATLDTYAISSGAVLTIRSDSYQCLNHSAAFGSLDTVTYSGIGGKLLIDGRAVRVIPFNTGSGTVPAIGVSITQGAASGALLGIWANWQSEPLAAGAAMPATGWIKLQSVSGGAFAAGALTGITASATGADRVGWLEVRGADTATITVPRVGAFEVLGDWFELGLTNGVRGQTLECPTTASVAGVFPGVWVETAPSSGVYERFSGAGSLVAATTIPTDERGKIIWQTVTGIRLGFDGTNNVGFLPPSGCRVRIPNVILTCCTRTVSGSGPRVLPNATLATRQEFITTSAGAINIQDAVVNWFCNFSQPFSVTIKDTAISDSLVLSEVASPLDVDNLIVAPTQGQLNTALNASSCFSGGNIRNARFTRFNLSTSGNFVNSANFLSGITFTNVVSDALAIRGNANTGTWTSTQTVDCTWTNCTNIGGKMLLSAVQRPRINGLRYADNFIGTTSTANACYAVEASNASSGLTITGFDLMGLANVQPYNGVLSVQNSYASSLFSIGSAAVPLNLGTVNNSGFLIAALGNCAGITVKRCFVSNTRSGLYTLTNSDTNIVFETIAGDYADADAIAGLNVIAKGISNTGSATGQISVYGTHWQDNFTSATTGKVVVSANEPTSSSAVQCSVTGGTPRFNSSGSVLLTAVGDAVTWVMPYFAKGHTAFANIAATLTGTLTANLTLQYQLDTGAGFGTLKTLSAANLSLETISPSSGFRLRIIATCATANATNALTNISIPTVTSSVAQSSNLYPLQTVTLTLSGIQPGSDVVILQAGTTTVLETGDAIAGSSYTYTYETLQNVDIGILRAGSVPLYIRNYALSSSNTSLPVAQSPDRNYQ